MKIWPAGVHGLKQGQILYQQHFGWLNSLHSKCPWYLIWLSNNLDLKWGPIFSGDFSGFKLFCKLMQSSNSLQNLLPVEKNFKKVTFLNQTPCCDHSKFDGQIIQSGGRRFYNQDYWLRRKLMHWLSCIINQRIYIHSIGFMSRKKWPGTDN